VTIFRELRRRRVFRFAGVYIVGAWVTIEVASVFFPAWGIPDTALRYLFIAAALLFPVALVFSWVFDITSEGIVRTRPPAPGEAEDLSLKKTDYAILVALAAVAVMVVLGSLGQVVEEIDDTPTVASEKPANSIAVLPFESLDDSPDASAYSAGISEAVLHKLASLGTLKVLARTSSFAFASSEKSPRELADILGVRYLLQGTLRREGDRVFISTTLIEDSGFEVWSDSFEASANEIFDLQSAVTREVARRVSDSPSLPQVALGATTNALAYQHYLIGREYANSRPPGWQEEAANAFRLSIAEDPDFAPAYAGLAMALYIGGGESDAVERYDEALQKATRAYELEPGHAEVLAVMGLLLLDGDSDALGEARQYLERAIALDPANSDAYNWLATALFGLGLEDEAAAVRERGLAVDPLNPALVTNVADRIAAQGNFDRAMAIRMRLMQLPEPPGVGLWGIYMQHTEYDDIAEGIYWAKQTALAYRGTQNQLAFFALAVLYAQLGMDVESDYWSTVLAEQHPDRLGNLIRAAYLAKLRGDTQGLEEATAAIDAMGVARAPRLPAMLKRRIGALFISSGRVDDGIPLLENGLDIDAPVSARSTSHETATMTYLLSLAYGARGDAELAEKTAGRADAIVSLLRSDEALQNSPSEIELLVLQHIFRNDIPSAAIALRNAIDAGWTNYYWYYNDPFLGEYARSPELAPLFDEALRNIEAQRRIVVERDAQDNFRERMSVLLESQ
jgi:TolB-like protein